MDTDDAPVGRLLTRRETLRLLGWAGAAFGIGVAPDARAQREPGAPAAGRLRRCVVRPEQTEGPYFVDEALARSDIRSDPASGEIKAGVPLALAFRISRIVNGECRPLGNTRVDLWQCDADGLYSGVDDVHADTRAQRYLRGHQVTGESGEAAFTTIYPGWYPGRTVHLHFKVRTNAGSRRGEEFTSQLYFDDALTDRVHARPPYAARGARRVRNGRDGIFRRGGGDLLLAPAAAAGGGYRAVFELALESP